MTYSREVIAYIAAHLGGYVVSMVLTQAVLMPVLIQTEFVRDRMGMMVVFFLLNVVVQVGVFFAFIAIRGRRQAG